MSDRLTAVCLPIGRWVTIEWLTDQTGHRRIWIDGKEVRDAP